MPSLTCNALTLVLAELMVVVAVPMYTMSALLILKSPAPFRGALIRKLPLTVTPWKELAPPETTMPLALTAMPLLNVAFSAKDAGPGVTSSPPAPLTFTPCNELAPPPVGTVMPPPVTTTPPPTVRRSVTVSVSYPTDPKVVVPETFRLPVMTVSLRRRTLAAARLATSCSAIRKLCGSPPVELASSRPVMVAPPPVTFRPLVAVSVPNDTVPKLVVPVTFRSPSIVVLRSWLVPPVCLMPKPVTRAARRVTLSVSAPPNCTDFAKKLATSTPPTLSTWDSPAGAVAMMRPLVTARLSLTSRALTTVLVAPRVVSAAPRLATTTPPTDSTWGSVALATSRPLMVAPSLLTRPEA